MSNKIKILVLIITAAFIFNVAQAEGENLQDKLSKGVIVITAQIKGCDADAKQYCPGLDPNGEKAFLCMMAYEDKLSETCKLGIAEAAMAIKMGAAAIDYSVRACEVDADKFCLDVKAGEGRIVRCIRKNEAKASKACIAALKETGLWDLGAKQ